MANKAKSHIKKNSHSISPAFQAEIDQKVVLSQTAVCADWQGALTTKEFSKDFGDLDLAILVDELSNHTTQVNSGDLSHIEDILTIQAHTLDVIFNNLARRAVLNIGEYMGAAETYLRLALKAQSQCRSTLEALAEIKNPRPMAFVRQANISNGPQQVNNGSQAASLPPAHGKIENQQNKLLEAEHGTQMDFGKAGAASSSNQALATVGKIDGAENGGR